MENRQIEKVEQIRQFVLAGNARFTLRNSRTGSRITYNVQKMDGRRGEGWFVKALTGPGNTSDYQLFGFIWADGGFRWWRKSRISQDAKSVKGFRWFFENAFEKGQLPEPCEFWHEGRCGRCNRVLTNPKSIAAGIGPKCSGRRDDSLPVLASSKKDVIFSGDRKPSPTPALPSANDNPPPAALSSPPSKPRKQTGQVFIDADENGLKVCLDAPWENDEHKAIKDRMWAATKCRWNKQEKFWSVSANLLAENYDEIFGSAEVVMTSEATEAISASVGRVKLASAASVNDDDLDARLDAVIPEGLELYPFQKAGVAFVEAADGRALIGDDMGLGKTIQAIAYLALHPELRPAVLIVPATVTINWANECAKWMPNASCFRIKNSKDEIPPGTEIVIVTYDLMRRRSEELTEMGFKALVADECHMVKNPKAKRTETFLKIAENADSIICLSGTPIKNRPVEFHTSLKLLRPSDFGNWFRFVERYCGAYQNRYGWQIGGASNTEELSARLKDVMVRRLKTQVLTELPEKTRQTVPIELDGKQSRAYSKAVKSAYDAAGGAAHLEVINAMRQWVGNFKVNTAVEWVKEFKEQSKPVLVFAHHKAVLDALQSACRSAGVVEGRIDGSVSQEERARLVASFQAGELDAMLISTLAGGVGITLTAAADVLFVERAWTPGDEEQAEDRCYRIGQENAVTIRYLVVEGTVDEMMHELIDSKRSVLRAVLDNQMSGTENLDIRRELVARWKEAQEKK